MMNNQELKNIAEQTVDNILSHILNNPGSESEITTYIKNNNKYKPKFYEVMAILKDSKQNKNGIGALRTETIKEVSRNSFNEVDISLLVDNPYQPRISMDEEAIQELASSIQKDGLQSPIKVSPIKDSTKFHIVFGHRRVEAHRSLGLDKIKCVIENVDNTKLRRLAWIENIQREELSLIEKAISYRNALIDNEFSSQRDLANSIGIREARVSETLSLLKLDDRIIEDLSKNKELKDVTTLSLLNKLRIEIQYEIYQQFKRGEIDREGIRKHLVNSSAKKTSQCETQFKNNKLQLFFKTNLKNKEKRKKFEEFARIATDKLVEELKKKEIELESI